MTTIPSNFQSPKSSRLVFVDLLRGWAVLVMIETHVFNALSLPDFKAAGWFDILNFVNGLVAPSFLFVSGFVFQLSAGRKIDELRTFGPAFRKQLGRMLVIWLVAYGLHLPFFSFRRIVAGTTADGWLGFFQSDILHCIVVGWLFLLFSIVFIRSEILYRWWLILTSLVIVFITPVIWETDFLPHVPAPVAAYLNGQHYSLFPIFPWMAFMVSGSVTASLYLAAMAKGTQQDFIKRISAVGFILILVSFLLALVPFRVEGLSTSWRANPLFFFLRLGIVFLLLRACWYYAERRRTEQSFVLDVSRESFLVYVVHLLILYGRYIDDKNVVDIYGGSFTPLECLLGSLGLAAVMVALSKFWGFLKRRSFVVARTVSYAVAMVTIVLFFVRKY